MSAYNFWYLVRAGQVHGVPSNLLLPGLPMTYLVAGALLSALCTVMTLARLFARRPAPGHVALGSAVISLGVFLFFVNMHERYALPAVVALVVAAATGSPVWNPYAMLSTTFFFNLVTIAPFSSALGANLVAVADASARGVVLRAGSLAAAAINVALLLWLWRVLGRVDAR